MNERLMVQVRGQGPDAEILNVRFVTSGEKDALIAGSEEGSADRPHWLELNNKSEFAGEYLYRAATYVMARKATYGSHVLSAIEYYRRLYVARLPEEGSSV